MKVSEASVSASLCRSSFEDFCREFWDTVIPDKLIWNWHMSTICGELQDVAERIFKGQTKAYDLIINVSPGSSKSTLASVMFPAWCWTRMEHFKYIGASYAHSLALDHSRKCRDVIKSEKYQDYFGIKLREDQDTKGYFVNQKNGQRFSVGSGGAVIGMHGHCIGIDDPIDPNSALSEVEMYQINNWIKETLSSRKTDRRVAPMILIMQRLHQEDPTELFLKRKRTRHICIPAEETEDVNPPELRKFYKNGLMDPIRLSKTVLEDTEQDLGPYGYAGQYLQSPKPQSGGMFDVTRLGRGFPSTIVRCVRYWDKAGTAGKVKKGRGAYTVGAKIGIDDANRIFIMDIIRVKMGSYNREKLIRGTAEVDGFEVQVGVEQEGGSGGMESAQMTVGNLIGFRIYIDVPKGDKEMRADPLSVQVNAGNVYLCPGAWNKDFIEEMKFFPYSSTKDQIDACSGALGILAKVRHVVGAIPSRKKGGFSRSARMALFTAYNKHRRGE